MIAIGILLFTFGCNTERCACKGEINKKDSPMDEIVCEGISKHVPPEIHYTVTTYKYYTPNNQLGVFFRLESKDLDPAYGYGHFSTISVHFNDVPTTGSIFIVDNMGTAIEDDEFIKAGVPEQYWRTYE